MENKKNTFQLFLSFFSWIFLGGFVVVLLFTATSNLNFFGGYKSLIVQSGSMEPAIKTGDIILINKANYYQINDVVTYSDTESNINTHRIIENKNGLGGEFITKGDANRIEDSESVFIDQIMGKVVLIIPKLGYFITFVRSRNGLIIFVYIPALLIVADEVIKIVNASRKKNMP